MFNPDNYQSCSLCGKYADDGGLKDNKFTCHDCLENNGKVE
jgi:hypothetical protein